MIRQSGSDQVVADPRVLGSALAPTKRRQSREASASAASSVIRLMERPDTNADHGDIVETEDPSDVNSKGING
jgi:hypothetical protein